MKKSATEVMQEIMFSAVVDSIGALKGASKGLPNTLLRDMNAIHANATFADLQGELQASITASVRAAFARLLKEGYAVSPTDGAPPRPPRPLPETAPRGGRGKPPPKRGPGDGRRPPRPGGPQPRNPRGTRGT